MRVKQALFTLFLLLSLSLHAEQPQPSLSTVQDNLTRVIVLLGQAKDISIQQAEREKSLQERLTRQENERKTERQSWQAKLASSEKDLQLSKNSLDSAKSSYEKARTNYDDTLTLLKDMTVDRDKYRDESAGRLVKIVGCLVVIAALLVLLFLTYFFRKLLP